jgi:predicted cobalt transporter CbtA
MTSESMVSERRVNDSPGRGLFRLWVIVTILWTCATLLRVHRTWTPAVGWQRMTWTLITFALPPLMFAIVLAVVRELTRLRHQRRT